MRQDVQAAFGRELLPPLGHQAHARRAHHPGHAHHFFRGGHLQIEEHFQSALQGGHVGVLDVPPVLPQVRGDRIRPAFHRRQGGLHDAGNVAPPGLPHGGHVIDVHSKQNHLRLLVIPAALKISSPGCKSLLTSRGDDVLNAVIPAEAGIQGSKLRSGTRFTSWTPASAGVTTNPWTCW